MPGKPPHTQTQPDGLPKGFERQTPAERKADLKQFAKELKQHRPIEILTAMMLGDNYRENCLINHKDYAN